MSSLVRQKVRTWSRAIFFTNFRWIELVLMIGVLAWGAYLLVSVFYQDPATLLATQPSADTTALSPAITGLDTWRNNRASAYQTGMHSNPQPYFKVFFKSNTP